MQLYVKLGNRIGLTIRQQGYPTKKALKTWYQEYEQTPSSHQLDLQDVVEAVVDVVLRFRTATAATELKAERLRPDVFDPHCGS